jgi:hypothetical protein
MVLTASRLDTVDVISPCTAAWDQMIGDAKMRFCSLCTKNVYDLSQLTRSEAEALIREKEGQLCVRYFRRADGRIMTQDCQKGFAARFRFLARFLGLLCLILLIFAFSVLLDQSRGPKGRMFEALRDSEPFKTLVEWIDPTPPPVPPPVFLGKM